MISLDENEQSNMRLMLNEIFSEQVETLVWNKEYEGKSGTLKQVQRFRQVHEYILTAYNNIEETGFSKIKEPLQGRESELQTANLAVNFKNERIDHPNYFTIENPSGDRFTKQWKWDEEKINDLIEQNLIYWGSDGKKQPRLIIPTDERRTAFLQSILNYGGTTQGRKDLERLIETGVFSYPKPVILLKKILESVSEEDTVIFDFFAGSSTTADAVMQLNAEDGGNRQFIMVQLDEPTYIETDRNTRIARKGSETAFHAGYMSIDEISRERIKRASQKIRDDKGLTFPENFDGGFKHYRVVKPTQASINDLETYDPNTGMFVDSKGMQVAFSESGFDDMIQPFSSEGLGVSGDATGVDTILTTWMIQDGYKLDNEVHQLDIDGYNVFYVEPTRIYLIDNNWNSNNTKMLLNKIGNYDLNVQTVVIYGYSFGLESIRELELGLKQLPNKVNLVKRY